MAAAPSDHLMGLHGFSTQQFIFCLLQYFIYRFIIVGHSLGAGVASVVSCLLHEEFPDLKCFAYAAPAPCLDERTAIWAEEFCTTVVLGSDLVPRISIVTVLKMRIQVLKALRSTNLPKWKIIAGRLAKESWWKDPQPLKFSELHLINNPESYRFVF